MSVVMAQDTGILTTTNETLFPTTQIGRLLWKNFLRRFDGNQSPTSQLYGSTVTLDSQTQNFSNATGSVKVAGSVIVIV